MPRVIDYVDRFDLIRHAVFEVVLTEGAAAVTLSRIATALYLSPATVRRLLGDPSALPRLGHDHAQDRWRRHVLFRSVPASSDRSAGVPIPVTPEIARLLAELPFTADHRDTAVVRRALTRAHPSTDWAHDALLQQHALLTGCVDAAVPSTCTGADREYESRRLLALVQGVTDGACTGWLTPDDVLPLVRQHLADLHAAWLVERGPGAA